MIVLEKGLSNAARRGVQLRGVQLLGSRHGRTLATVKNDRFINILEVAARDGLQNESKVVSVDDKVELVTRIAKAGFKNVSGRRRNITLLLLVVGLTCRCLSKIEGGAFVS
jgi:hypothetical protein